MQADSGPVADNELPAPQKIGSQAIDSANTTTQQEPPKAKKKTPPQPSKGGPSHQKSSKVSSAAELPTSSNKKNRRKKENVDRAAAKSNDGGGGAGEDPVGKVRLKTVIRRLPPNVPEAVFWKAVSPWVTRSKTIVNEQTSGDALLDQGKVNVDYAYFVQGKLKDGSRRGVNLDSNVSSHVYSRAYVRFTSIEALIEFHRAFDGHLFKDAKGHEYNAIVEFAPFQRTPVDLAKRKKADPRQGTIEEDSDYKAFLISLEKKRSEENGQTQAEKTDAQLMSQLLSTQSNTTNHAERAKHTPLLDHLRAKHTARAESSALKNARSYLNRNNNAYAAATSSKAAEKGKSKGKGQAKEAAIPTGPKASRKQDVKGQKKGKSMAVDGGEAPPLKGAANATSGAKGAAKGQKGGGVGKGPGKGAPNISEDGLRNAISKKEMVGASENSSGPTIATGPSAERGRGGHARGRPRPARGGGGGRGRGGAVMNSSSNRGAAAAATVSAAPP